MVADGRIVVVWWPYGCRIVAVWWPYYAAYRPQLIYQFPNIRHITYLIFHTLHLNVYPVIYLNISGNTKYTTPNTTQHREKKTDTHKQFSNSAERQVSAVLHREVEHYRLRYFTNKQWKYRRTLVTSRCSRKMGFLGKRLYSFFKCFKFFFCQEINLIFIMFINIMARRPFKLDSNKGKIGKIHNKNKSPWKQQKLLTMAIVLLSIIPDILKRSR